MRRRTEGEQRSGEPLPSEAAEATADEKAKGGGGGGGGGRLERPAETKTQWRGGAIPTPCRVYLKKMRSSNSILCSGLSESLIVGRRERTSWSIKTLARGWLNA
jgi:hypothetical protein